MIHGRSFNSTIGGEVQARCYNKTMLLRVEAIYEKGVLRPLQPLDLKEHERVVVSVVKATAPDGPKLDVEYLEEAKRQLQAGSGSGRSSAASR
jgi:predicted DNA-binding antitoxin AbrB/MazE fold protein